ncbi:ImuA family protein [Porphyrobacter sp. GA68]|uniref:ImuA family protein n=1 Tax=Porphyrobacter sp. GA68 TaxID=2883480 RepID=UPI001D18DA02|nr:protein ImuA [Porphyrobacter sp. GA68]
MSHPVPSLAELRRTICALESAGNQELATLPFGCEAVDEQLVRGGLRVDALHEATALDAGWASDAAATLFLASIAARTGRSILWIIRTRDLFAPGLYQIGLAPERVLYAEAGSDAELLAVMEEGVRHRGLGAVIGEAKRVPTAATRRLQLAAEGGNTMALLLRRPSREGADSFGVPSAAVTRWRVGCAPSPRVAWDGLGRACWHLACARQRGGNPFELIVEAADETGRLALPAQLADRPAAAERAAARATG